MSLRPGSEAAMVEERPEEPTPPLERPKIDLVEVAPVLKHLSPLERRGHLTAAVWARAVFSWINTLTAAWTPRRRSVGTFARPGRQRGSSVLWRGSLLGQGIRLPAELPSWSFGLSPRSLITSSSPVVSSPPRSSAPSA